MSHTPSNKLHFLSLHPIVPILVTSLLLLLILGLLGQWYLSFILVGIAIFFSISVIVFSTMIHLNRDAGSDDKPLSIYL